MVTSLAASRPRSWLRAILACLPLACGDPEVTRTDTTACFHAGLEPCTCPDGTSTGVRRCQGGLAGACEGCAAGGQAGSGGTGTSGSSGQGGVLPPVATEECAQAATQHPASGCEFWPTVTANVVGALFDFAVVVSNPGEQVAEVVVERGGQSLLGATLAAGEQQVLYLPWVEELKVLKPGCLQDPVVTASVKLPGGAYHLTSTRPVEVVQFNAIENVGGGGPPGKSWENCVPEGCSLPCASYSNDASRLLPSSAQGLSYRVVTQRNISQPDLFTFPALISVTGLADGTQVSVRLPPGTTTLAGPGLAAGSAASPLSFTVQQGEVVELFSQASSGDLSGSLIEASRPVQVIAGARCTLVPDASTLACDHIEETMPPVEALGQRYLVAPPTGPRGDAPGHVVKLVGHVDGTVLTYKGTPPAGAPTVLGAGQVVDLGIVSSAFEIDGSAPFLIGLLTPGGTRLDPESIESMVLGDPDLSVPVPIEHFRSSYTFHAPNDHDTSFADVIAPSGSSLQLDDQPVTLAGVAIADTGYQLWRLPVAKSADGHHRLVSSAPASLQVMGHGTYVSYQYPGAAP